MGKKLLIGLLCVLVVIAIAVPALNIIKKSNDGISINTSFKTEYYMGEKLDLTGGTLNYTKDGNTKQVNITSDMVNGFTSVSSGTRTLVISYQGFTCTVPYTIIYVRCVQDNEVYQGKGTTSFFGGSALSFIFKDNCSKMIIGRTEDGSKATDVSQIEYSYNEEWRLTEKYVYEGQYVLKYEYGTIKSFITNITEDGFLWEYVNTNPMVAEFNIRFTKLGQLPTEENVSIKDDEIFLSTIELPSNMGEFSNELLYLKFKDNNTKVLIGEVKNNVLGFPASKECEVNKVYKNGKLTLKFYNTYAETNHITFYVENITETQFTVRLSSLDGMIFNMTKF